jgi:DNA-damage-inducible protein J
MHREADIRGKVTPEIKEQFKNILAQLGLTPSVAIAMFAQQVIQCRGLPFRPQIHQHPNQETLNAMADIENNTDLTTHDNLDDLFASWDKEMG